MFEPPVSTPTARTTAIAAFRSSWYASSGSVICGATVTESPVCTPIGSRFSIEQTITTLSAWSRTTSSSNSSQPRTDSSTSTCEIGDSESPRATCRCSCSCVSAKPPPWPPSVNAGRTTAGSETPTRSSTDVTIRDVGTFSPHDSTVRLKSSRSSARWIASMFAPISSMPSSSSTPASCSSRARLSAVPPPIVGRSASGRSRCEDARDALDVERLQVGAVGEPGVGHDRRGIRVDDDRAVAVLAQHLQRLTARVVELGRLADHDRPGADQADRMDVRPLGHQADLNSSTQPEMIDEASCGPGVASGWNCAERARSSRVRRAPRRCRRRARCA